MNGTEKQIKWARDIQEKTIEAIRNISDEDYSNAWAYTKEITLIERDRRLPAGLVEDYMKANADEAKYIKSEAVSVVKSAESAKDVIEERNDHPEKQAIARAVFWRIRQERMNLEQDGENGLVEISNHVLLVVEGSADDVQKAFKGNKAGRRLGEGSNAFHLRDDETNALRILSELGYGVYRMK